MNHKDHPFEVLELELMQKQKQNKKKLKWRFPSSCNDPPLFICKLVVKDSYMHMYGILYQLFFILLNQMLGCALANLTLRLS